MIAWAHVLAWPVAAVVIAFQLRRCIVAAAIAHWSSDWEPPAGMEPVAFAGDDGKDRTA